MAGMFYTIQEVAAKLGKTEDQVKQMVQDKKLHEFHDGATSLFRVDKVDAMCGGCGPTE